MTSAASSTPLPLRTSALTCSRLTESTYALRRTVAATLSAIGQDPLHEGDKAAERGLAAHETPREAADRHTLIEDAIDLTARVLDVDDLEWEQVVVHDLNVVVRPDLFERPAQRSCAFLAWSGRT